MIVFAEEEFKAGSEKEIGDLTSAHWEEIGREGYPLKPAWEAYVCLSLNGNLKYYTARESSVLVGYAVFVVTDNPHCVGSRVASQDALYLSKSSRKGSVGLKFIKFCDEMLSADGVELVTHTSTARRDIGPIFKRIGYKAIGTNYERRLGQWAIQ